MAIVEARAPGLYPTLPAGGDGGSPWLLRENVPPAAPKPRLLDRVRQALRARHMSRRTEEAYVAWIRRFYTHVLNRGPAAVRSPADRMFSS